MTDKGQLSASSGPKHICFVDTRCVLWELLLGELEYREINNWLQTLDHKFSIALTFLVSSNLEIQGKMFAVSVFSDVTD